MMNCIRNRDSDWKRTMDFREQNVPLEGRKERKNTNEYGFGFSLNEFGKWKADDGTSRKSAKEKCVFYVQIEI